MIISSLPSFYILKTGDSECTTLRGLCHIKLLGRLFMLFFVLIISWHQSFLSSFYGWIFFWQPHGFMYCRCYFSFQLNFQSSSHLSCFKVPWYDTSPIYKFIGHCIVFVAWRCVKFAHEFFHWIKKKENMNIVASR